MNSNLNLGLEARMGTNSSAYRAVHFLEALCSFVTKLLTVVSAVTFSSCKPLSILAGKLNVVIRTRKDARHLVTVPLDVDLLLHSPLVCSSILQTGATDTITLVVGTKKKYDYWTRISKQCILSCWSYSIAENKFRELRQDKENQPKSGPNSPRPSTSQSLAVLERIVSLSTSLSIKSRY
jgi:hypothetical protein